MDPHEAASVSVCRHGSAAPGSDPVRTVVWVRGDHEYGSREQLSVAMAEAVQLDDAGIVVDLSGVTFMDASTISALVEAYRRMRSQSRWLTVRAPSGLARRLLRVCDLAFLIDEDPAPGRSPAAPALDSWVAVPAADRASDPAQPAVTEPEPPLVPARAASPAGVEPAASGQRRSSPS